jgi:hypothetical protein
MKKEISLDEEMLMFTSYRYCIGRQTYVTSLAPYIGKKYYPLLSYEKAEHTAKDIRNCIADVLNYGSLTFRYDGTVSERDALSDFLTWLNDNVESEKDLIGIDAIECYKEDYKPDTPKKFFVTKKKHCELPKYETDFTDLLEWHRLSSLFDRKNHVKVWVIYDGKEECIECFYAWEKALTLQDDGLYRQTPWKYKKCLISVDRYLEKGDHAGRLDEAFITKIE